ncbi:hypothetical protein JFU37_22910 [Pseudomonas sp. TH41]|uniref:hypothetical protein n=1 Tax=Pseudomonas sp. TH41 TaxID=2796405 RepID=UPI0019112C45|nr:hypothetical protein [Pseudomonas sp. TH41]MBK5355338.1 hypothetical protein [Pseudomonas sp. TH41]
MITAITGITAISAITAITAITGITATTAIHCRSCRRLRSFDLCLSQHQKIKRSQPSAAPTVIPLRRFISQKGPNPSVYGKLRAYKHRPRGFKPSPALADWNKALPGLPLVTGADSLCVGTSVPTLSA